MSSVIQPDTVLKELSTLWSDLAKQEGDSSVLRACAMTLIVIASQQDGPQDLNEVISRIMHDYPSRVIVLRFSPEHVGPLASRVYAQCWRPSKHQQICCEIVEVAGTALQLAAASKLVSGIAVPDLPIVLWSRNPEVFHQPEASALFALANKIIVDSARFSDPHAGLEYVLRMAKQTPNLADLSWTRLTAWRQAVSQMFEDAGRPQLTSIRLTYRQEGPSVAGRYLAAWFRLAVPKAKVVHEAAANQGSRSVTIEGSNFHGCLTMEKSGALMTVNGLQRQSAVPERDDATLLLQELAILAPDTRFKQVLDDLQTSSNLN